MDQPRQPILNVPPVVIAVLIVLTVVHGVRMLLPPAVDRLVIWTFGFVPARYDSSALTDGLVPGGAGAEFWSFFTYALLHGNLAHLGFNAIWLIAFASPVARRFGTKRFLLFFLVTVGAGALAYLFVHAGAYLPMIGASAGVSGMMGGAARFVFEPGGSLDRWRSDDPETADHVPAAPLSIALRRRRVVSFLVVWFALNFLFGFVSVPGISEGQSVAWEAHLGGFLAGLLLFDAFDPLLRPGSAKDERHPG